MALAPAWRDTEKIFSKLSNFVSWQSCEDKQKQVCPRNAVQIQWQFSLANLPNSKHRVIEINQTIEQKLKSQIGAIIHQSRECKSSNPGSTTNYVTVADWNGWKNKMKGFFTFWRILFFFFKDMLKSELRLKNYKKNQIWGLEKARHNLILMNREGRTSIKDSLSRYWCLPLCLRCTDLLKTRAVQVDQLGFLVTQRKSKFIFQNKSLFSFSLIFLFVGNPKQRVSMDKP